MQGTQQIGLRNFYLYFLTKSKTMETDQQACVFHPNNISLSETPRLTLVQGNSNNIVTSLLTQVAYVG